MFLIGQAVSVRRRPDRCPTWSARRMLSEHSARSWAATWVSRVLPGGHLSAKISSQAVAALTGAGASRAVS